MVILSRPDRPASTRRRRSQRGSLSVELTVAVGILVMVLMPLSVSFGREQVALRGLYQRAVAMEIVDGEAEVLRAGAWRAFTNGSQPYPVRAGAATNLPPGEFILTLEPGRGRLEWRPAGSGAGSPVGREFPLPAERPAP